MRLDFWRWKLDRQNWPYMLAALMVFFIGLAWLQWENEKLHGLYERRDNHVVRDKNYWRQKEWFNKSLLDRIQVAPSEVIEYIRLDNKLNHWPNQPRPVNRNSPLYGELEVSLQQLPRSFRNLIEDRLLGLFWVEDLGGSAYVESVFDKDGDEQGEEKVVGAFVVLDSNVLERTANEWASYREMTPFQLQENLKIDLRIADKKNNTRARALDFILLHELSHVASIGHKLHPPWGSKAESHLSDYRFTKLSWKRSKSSQLISRFDKEFPWRSQIQFYAPSSKQLSSDLAVDIYKALDQTNFPSLYAVLSPAEDFAESLAIFLHTQVLKRPYNLQILKNQKEIFAQKRCWAEKPCTDKRRVIEELLDLRAN